MAKKEGRVIPPEVLAQGQDYVDWWCRRDATHIDCSGDEPVTKQEFKDDCDVNVIVARCLRDGVERVPQGAAPVFADVSQIGDFGEAMRRVQRASEAFASLDASIRTRFENDPRKLIAFVQDVRNYDEAVKLGLVVPSTKSATDVPAVAPVVPPAK